MKNFTLRKILIRKMSMAVKQRTTKMEMKLMTTMTMQMTRMVGKM